MKTRDLLPRELKSLQLLASHKQHNGSTNIKGGDMSNEEAEALMEEFEKWDAKHAKHDFISRMERKLSRKERLNRA